MTTLKQALAGQVYQSYSYSYPHKTAYRFFEQPQKITDIWSQEKSDALFLYIHLPFCEMRCGFCNLFTLVRPEASLPDLYLDALEKQAKRVFDAIGDVNFARFAIGGGTPSYLTTQQLERLFTISEKSLYLDSKRTPMAIEISPDTIDPEKLSLFNQVDINRVSIGIQSFVDTECTALARKQSSKLVHEKLAMIRQHSNADLNVDLIYGIQGQTETSWLYSLEEAIKHQPEEFYLYPLYVREKTGLQIIKDKRNLDVRENDDRMLRLYSLGRDFLLSNGYEQVSMRMFRTSTQADTDQPIYSCQNDGMLGLGAGARSYTQKVHYSSEYAVGRHGVKDVITHYLERTEEDFANANYGVQLSLDEQKRRFLMQSLLITEGLTITAYNDRFSTDCFDDFPELNELIELSLATQKDNQVQLTRKGMERADTIGPWLASSTMLNRMKEYALR